MLVKYTGATTLNLSALGLSSSVATNAIFEIDPLKRHLLTSYAALSSFLDVTPQPNPPVMPGDGAELVTAKYTYRVGADPGTQLTHPMHGPTIPNGARVVGGHMEVLAVPVGVGASIAVQLNAADDIIAAAAISGAPWSTTGVKAIVPVFTAATLKTTTANRRPAMVISAANLTAGSVDLYLVYYVPD